MRLALLTAALFCAATLGCSDSDETLAETKQDDSSDDSTDDATDDSKPSAGNDAGTTDDEPGPEQDAGALECTLDQEDPEEPEGFSITFTDETVECGSEMCPGATIDGFGIGTQGCCADQDEGICGLDMSTLGLLLNLEDPGCEQLNRPGSCDPACGPSEAIALPSFGGADVPADGVQLPGCCQADGTCGFQANFGGFGFGCVSPDRFGQAAGGDCDYTP